MAPKADGLRWGSSVTILSLVMAFLGVAVFIGIVAYVVYFNDYMRFEGMSL